VKKTKTLNAEGMVKIGPRNITTNPPKRGKFNTTAGHTFNKYPAHMVEEYDRARKQKQVPQTV
jgi:hypothetical protein